MYQENVEKYSLLRRDAAQDLLRRCEAFAAADLLTQLDDAPDNGFYIGSPSCPSCMEGLAVHGAATGDARASMGIFIAPELRYKGRGTALMRALLEDMEGKGVQVIFADFDVDSDLSPFFGRFGFAERFHSLYMTRSKFESRRLHGGLPPKYRICGYRDEDYPRVQSLIAEAFRPMREGLGISPYTLPPTERGREYLARIQDSVLTVYHDERLIGAVSFHDGEIDDLSVDAAYRGQGVGSALLNEAIQILTKRGSEEIRLWCVSDNPAQELYRKFGFASNREHCFCIRTRQHL